MCRLCGVVCQCWFFIPCGLPGFLSCPCCCCCWPRPGPVIPLPRPPNRPENIKRNFKFQVENIIFIFLQAVINTGAYDELPPTSATPSSSFALLLVLLGASTATALGHHILLHHVDDLVWDSQILNGASSDVALGHPPEFVSILSEGNKWWSQHWKSLSWTNSEHLSGLFRWEGSLSLSSLIKKQSLRL